MSWFVCICCVQGRFHRKPLPESCTDLCSATGVALFKQGLAAGTMQCYFSLSSQFRTQDEPAFCGLGTLVMVLNALGVDPGTQWKGVWRWFSEEALDCCKPLDEVRKEGITHDEFSCLAICNGLSVTTV